jgi:hypothetical protein
LAIVLSVLFFFWPLCCLSFFSFGHCVVCPFFLLAIVLSVLRFTDTDYPFLWSVFDLLYFHIYLVLDNLAIWIKERCFILQIFNINTDQPVAIVIDK